MECFHAFLGATIVAPGHQPVPPLPPEFIAPQDGAEKQDCERSAAKRWLARHGRSVAHLRPIFLGDDLFACQPIAAAIQQSGGNFILTCKPSSHQTITAYLHGATLEEHRQTNRKGRNVTITTYHWLSDVPLRATADANLVNWFSIETRNAAGKRTYYNSFVTDLPVTADTVAKLAACARARWKIENETFNVLKTNGYPFSPDWRWLTDRNDSPWYRTARLFRQNRRGDWNDVVSGVAQLLSVKNFQHKVEGDQHGIVTRPSTC